MQYEKVYVGVYTFTDTGGSSRPVSLVWKDGRVYRINKILSVKSAPPDHEGGLVAIRYEVDIEGHIKILYYESYLNKWFVEKLL